MNIVLIIGFAVLCAGICAVHVISAFGTEHTHSIAVPVGIFLHVPLYLCMLFLSFSLKVAALVFMASVTLYSVLGGIAYALRKPMVTADNEEVKDNDI